MFFNLQVLLFTNIQKTGVWILFTIVISPIEIKVDLSVTIGETAYSFTIVKAYAVKFDCMISQAAKRCGIEVHKTTTSYHRLKLKKVIDTSDISKERSNNDLIESLKMGKLWTRQVPRLLISGQKLQLLIMSKYR